MEAQTDIIKMLQIMDRPAFCVLDGQIIGANQAALGRLVPSNGPVAPLLVTGHAEYAAFTEGLLSITVEISGVRYGATVYAVGTHHIFTLEPQFQDSALQALALAALEFREPLNQIIALTETMFPQLEESSSAYDQASGINRGLYQLLRLVDNMSGTARYSTNVPKLTTRDVDAVIREIAEKAATLCESLDVEISYQGLPAPAYSLIDTEQLERSIYNILANALKHTPSGSRIQMRLSRTGNTLYLTIQDSGPGISDGVSSHLFQRYQREPSILDGAEGIGLGLAMARVCASNHGGTVLVGSKPGQGFTLTMSLPIRLGEGQVRESAVPIDYGCDPALVGLSEHLPKQLYKP